VTDANHTDRAVPPVRYVAPVTAEQLQAAVRILMRAWAPTALLPGDEGYDDQDGYLDPSEYCSCGGEDEDGYEVGCNCGPSCNCDSCRLYAWQMYKRCHGTTDVYACHREPAYRVVSFRMVRTSLHDASQSVVCPHTPGAQCQCPGPVWVDAGVKPQESRWQPACSIAHAQHLLEQIRAYDGKIYAHAAPEDRPRYRIEPWTYVPHTLELPEHLAALRTTTASAVSNIAHAVEAHGHRRDPFDWLQYAREHLARAAWVAAQPVVDPDDGFDDDSDDPPSGGPMEDPDGPGDSDGPWDQEPAAAEASAS
jgi:hypothetical protein